MGKYLEIANKFIEGRRSAESLDPTEGPIVAVKIASSVLSTDIWLAFREDFQPAAGEEAVAVFYAHEIPLLSEKTTQQLREIHRVKLAVGPGSRVRQ